jgi:hypothetical protein
MPGDCSYIYPTCVDTLGARGGSFVESCPNAVQVPSRAELRVLPWLVRTCSS